MTTSNEEIMEMLGSLRSDLQAHIMREELQRTDAFPGGDILAHRIAHEQMMEAAREQTKFWRELRLEVAKKGVWFLLVVIAGLVVMGVYAKLGVVHQ